MFAVGLAALPQGYDQGAEGYWRTRALEDENAARKALGNYFGNLPPASLPQSIPSGSPGGSFPPVSGAPSAVAPALAGGAAAEAAAINAGTWAPTPDYGVGVDIGAAVGSNPPPGGATMGGQPGAPLSAIIPGGPPAGGLPAPPAAPSPAGAPVVPPAGAPMAAPPAAPLRTAQAAPAPPSGPAGGVSRGTPGPQSWEDIARGIARANPGIKPDVLMRAVQAALPLMQSDSRLWYQAMQSELGAARLKAQYDLAGSRQNAITQLMNDFKRNNPYATPEEEVAYFRAIQGDPTKLQIAQTRAAAPGKSPAAVALQKFIQEGEEAGTPRTAQEIQDFTNQPSFLKQERSIAAAGERTKAQQEGAMARTERRGEIQGGIAAENRASRERIAADAQALRERIATLNRDQKLELFNRSYEQREEQFRERAALAQQKLNQGKPSADDLEAVSDAIAHYRINPSTALARLNAQARSEILKRVQEINPKWTQSDWKTSYDGITRFTTGRQGDSVRFLSVADNHLKVLEDLTKKLANPSDLRAVRAVVNWAQKQEGGEAVTNFETARHFVASEVTKAVIGGPGGLGDRIAAQAPIDPNASVPQIMGSVGTYRQLITGQLKGLKSQFERIPGTAPDEWDNRFGKDILTEPPPPPPAAKEGGGIKFNWVTPPGGP
ncbi:MAG TPA: hypothetical protein VF748_14965 [Candidatus Acidoferrum sp.]